MRAALFSLCLLAATPSHASSDTADTSRPQNFALVAALGDSFNAVTEVMSVGSHLPPYCRHLINAGDALNQIVLGDLDQQVAALAPNSKRTLVSFPAGLLPKAISRDRAKASLDAVVARLKTMPERANWDRIFIITPAYQAMDKNDMGSQLQGMGLFIEPLCKSDITSCNNETRPVSGPVAEHPDGSKTAVNSYFAPYTYITVWELDAATLNVMEKLEVFKHQLMVGDEHAITVVQDSDRRRIAAQMVKLVDLSIHEALRQTDLAGHVEAQLLKEPPAAPEK